MLDQIVSEGISFFSFFLFLFVFYVQEWAGVEAVDGGPRLIKKREWEKDALGKRYFLLFSLFFIFLFCGLDYLMLNGRKHDCWDL